MINKYIYIYISATVLPSTSGVTGSMPPLPFPFTTTHHTPPHTAHHTPDTSHPLSIPLFHHPFSICHLPAPIFLFHPPFSIFHLPF